MSVRAFAALVAGIMLAAGLIALAVPVTATTAEVGCGNGYVANDHDAQVNDLASLLRTGEGTSASLDGCNDALATRRGWSIPLAAVGALGLLGAATVNRKTPPPAQS